MNAYCDAEDYCEDYCLENLTLLNLDIDFDAIRTFENKIGRGSYCVIYRLKNDSKVFRHAHYQSGYYLTDSESERLDRVAKNVIVKEHLLLQALDHPNIIKPIGLCYENEEFYQILPYYDSFPIWLKKNKLTKEIFLKWTWQLFSVLNYFEDNLLVHRDIRNCNLLVSEDDDIIVIDFNVARKVAVDNQNPMERLGGINTIVGYSAYEWAPELKNRDLPLDFNADLYMAIISLLSILKNDLHTQFLRMNHTDRNFFTVTSSNQFFFGESTFEEAFPQLFDLFESGLNPDPLERISSKQAFLEIDGIIARKYKKSAKK